MSDNGFVKQGSLTMYFITRKQRVESGNGLLKAQLRSQLRDETLDWLTVLQDVVHASSCQLIHGAVSPVLRILFDFRLLVSRTAR